MDDNQNNNSNNNNQGNGNNRYGRYNNRRRKKHGPRPQGQRDAADMAQGAVTEGANEAINTPSKASTPPTQRTSKAAPSSDEHFPSYLMRENEQSYSPATLKVGDPDLSDFDFDTAPEPPASTESEENTVEVAGVRFKHAGKVYYFAPGDIKLKCGEHAIVETARGAEYGEVWMANRFVPDRDIVLPLRPVIRIATPEDAAHNEQNKQKEKEAFNICIEKIAKHGLDMKLVDAQYTFDNSKLLFYFTSSGRVDFRELVKDLASVFRTRIELRQIGIRDEAKLLGGLGACGRPLCCSSFLADFVQVSIKMAKEQSLSLNSNKISGSCGRLMCCLRYEYDTYVEEIKKTPPVESVVRTPDGNGVVIEMSPLAGTVKVRLNEKQDNPIKVYNRADVIVVSRPKFTEKDKDAHENE